MGFSAGDLESTRHSQGQESGQQVEETVVGPMGQQEYGVLETFQCFSQ